MFSLSFIAFSNTSSSWVFKRTGRKKWKQLKNYTTIIGTLKFKQHCIFQYILMVSPATKKADLGGIDTHRQQIT